MVDKIFPDLVHMYKLILNYTFETITRSSASPGRPTASSRTVVAAPTYVSRNRTKPNGPNKENAKGPDPSLLM